MFRQNFGRVPDRWLQNYAYIMTETWVDRKSRPNSFLFLAGLRLIVTALRWNRGISADMWHEALRLIADLLRRTRTLGA